MSPGVPLQHPVSHLAADWRRPEILEAIFSQLSDALFLYDNNLHIVGLNPAAERLFGISASEMIGKHCQELFRCTACESGCGIRQGLGPSACLPNGTVRIHLQSGRERIVVHTNGTTAGCLEAHLRG